MLAACSSGSTRTTKAANPKAPYNVYWDQNEEVDLLAMPSGTQSQLIPPWDPNGQLCVQPGGEGKFTTGYNPTLPGQHNPGGLKPYKQPPVGEAFWAANGDFTGVTVAVPGPYTLPGHSKGGDIPPDASAGNAYNDNGTYTGCAFDNHGNLFATDLGTAQGQMPPPDNGRLVEWFAPNFNTFCIVMGPTAGGTGPHHVDGTGGLRQPGLLTFAPNGDLFLPVAGDGQVLRIAAASLPTSAAACGPDGLYPRSDVHSHVFVDRSTSQLLYPLAVARDPSCSCWGVDSVIGDPAVIWVDDNGKPLPKRGAVAGTGIGSPSGYSPFGLAFAPDGTLYFVDIHIACKDKTLNDCGPVDNGGRIMKVTFPSGKPAAPVAVASGFNFPVSVTVCVPSVETCPYPTGALKPPASGPPSTSAPAVGPSSQAPATAGNGG